MAHSFRFIYWKVCCYFCIRPKKRRKKHKPLTTYRPPIVRPCATTNLRRSAPLCIASPNGSPSSTYYTAQVASDESASSRTVTSPPSSPILSQNSISPPPFTSPPLIPEYPAGVNENSVEQDKPVYYHEVPPLVRQDFGADVPLVPVIPNKYVLQPGHDVPLDVLVKENLHKEPAIFTVSNNQPRECRYALQPPIKSNNSIFWQHDSRHLDTNLMDDESRSGLTPELDDDEEEVSVPMWLCMTLVVSYICGGAVLFTFWEKWNFLDSSYFCFVTLTTIGFGDLVPGTAVISDDNQLTLGLCSLYLLFGMALLAMSFNLVQEEVTKSVKCIGQRIGIVSDDEDE